MGRTRLREIIIKILYQTYIFDEKKIDYDINDIIKSNLEIENEFVNECITNIIDKQQIISDYANKYMKDWNIDRIGKVDKAILSLGIYELLYTDTPSIVAINEAIELSKKYSDEKVIKMINAVLDNIYKKEVNNE